MKRSYLVILLMSAFALFTTGCDNVNPPTDQYTNGIFVIDEGAFGSSNAELSFIKSDNSVLNNIYASSNNGLQLGDVLQSMHINNGKAYLVVNNSNKVEVVNTSDLKNTATIGNLNMPRYMITYNGIGYISEWAGFSGNGNIKVVNLSTNTIVDSVVVGVQPEQMTMIGNNLLVANGGDSTLHLVNTTNLSVTNVADVDYPKFIAKTNDGNVWILYTGKPFWSGTNTDGGLLVLNSAGSIVKNIIIGSTTSNNPSQLASDGDNLYYEYQGNIYKIDKNAVAAPSSPFISGPAMSLYGLSYYSANNTLLVADAKNFTTSGVVKRFDASTGSLLDTLNVGVAPNGFVFN